MSGWQGEAVMAERKGMERGCAGEEPGHKGVHHHVLTWGRDNAEPCLSREGTLPAAFLSKRMGMQFAGKR